MPSITLGKKRPSEAIVQNSVKPKKILFGADGEAKTVVPAPAISAPDEIDFPRGGGSSFTPLEQKAIRAEAIKEADEEIFNVRAPRRGLITLILSTGAEPRCKKSKEEATEWPSEGVIQENIQDERRVTAPYRTSQLQGLYALNGSCCIY